VTNAWGIAADSFPTFPNQDVPEMLLNVTAVPEPTSFALFLSALGALGWLARRRP
jgi:hypothetical protein